MIDNNILQKQSAPEKQQNKSIAKPYVIMKVKNVKQRQSKSHNKNVPTISAVSNEHKKQPPISSLPTSLAYDNGTQKQQLKRDT